MNRSKFEEVFEILSLLKGCPRKVTHLMYKSNLSFKGIRKYLGELEQKGFVEKQSDGFYAITDFGVAFVDGLGTLLEMFYQLPIEILEGGETV